MAKMTKSQAIKAITRMQNSAGRLFLQTNPNFTALTSQDYIALEKILNRAYKRLK